MPFNKETLLQHFLCIRKVPSGSTVDKRRLDARSRCINRTAAQRKMCTVDVQFDVNGVFFLAFRDFLKFLMVPRVYILVTLVNPAKHHHTHISNNYLYILRTYLMDTDICRGREVILLTPSDIQSEVF